MVLSLDLVGSNLASMYNFRSSSGSGSESSSGAHMTPKMDVPQNRLSSL